jgi:hypothetical protein
MANDGMAPVDTSGGDMGGADTGSPAPSGGDPAASREPAQVIPRARGEGDDGDDDGAPDANGQPRVRTPKPTKHKVKFFGQEREIASLEDVLPMLSDDYELEVPVSGQTRKAKYPDLVRGYQMSEGAFDRMRKAAELEKTIGSRLEHAKKDPAWALEMLHGVPDHVRWAAEVVRNQMSQEKELDELYQTDRFEWQRRMDKLADDRKARRDAYEAEQKRSVEEARTRKEAAERTEGEVRKACEAVGMKWNAQTRSIAGEIYQKYQQVGHQLPPADVAAMARAEYVKQINEHLDSLDDEGLVKFLGDARRKKLRQYELAEVRRGGKVQEAPKPANTNGAKPKQDSKGMTEKEFKNQWR